MPAVSKVWRLLPHDRDAISALARSLQVSPIVAQLLLNRGIADPAAARRFLDAPLSGLHPPQLLPGATAAADRLALAVERKEKVCVYGDYDTDGLTGTAILGRMLALLQVPIEYYVPDRLKEGYGLNVPALRERAEDGVRLVVTVDCGIAAPDEADEARRLGLDLIITDHHEPKDRLPDATVLVHPRLPGGDYPFGGLCGAGVAFKVAWALAQKISGSDKVQPKFREALLDSVALAALGLIADVVPLHDENRIFVRHGLPRLQNAPLPGLKALLETAKLGDSQRPLRAEDVAYRLAPRMNAVGRLGCARLVVDLLTTTSPPKARELAEYLEKQNQDRQTIERKIAATAREMLDGQDLTRMPAIVLANPEWHPGVIGIVAGRLAEQFGRPVLLAGQANDGGTCPGSGRSIPGFALHEALQACGEHLVSHGGHAMAAGFRLRPENLQAFRAAMCDYAARRFPAGTPPPPQLTLDAEVPLSALTHGLVNDLDRLEPYGAENRKPIMLAGGLQVTDPRRIGGGERHLSFRVRQQNTNLRVIAFGMGERLEELMSDGGRCCLAFTPRINEWKDFRNVELEAVDFQPGPVARLG